MVINTGCLNKHEPSITVVEENVPGDEKGVMFLHPKHCTQKEYQTRFPLQATFLQNFVTFQLPRYQLWL